MHFKEIDEQLLQQFNDAEKLEYLKDIITTNQKILSQYKDKKDISIEPIETIFIPKEKAESKIENTPMNVEVKSLVDDLFDLLSVTLTDNEIYSLVEEYLQMYHSSSYLINCTLLELEKYKIAFQDDPFFTLETNILTTIQEALIVCREKENIELEQVEQNQLYFLKNGQKNYFFDDLDKISIEYYSSCLQLLESIQNGSFKGKSWRHLNSTNGKVAGIKELKGFQIRIFFNQLDSRSYLILGAMIKKANWNKGIANTVAQIKNRYINANLKTDIQEVEFEEVTKKLKRG